MSMACQAVTLLSVYNTTDITWTLSSDQEPRLKECTKMALRLMLKCGLLWCGLIIRELVGSDRKEDALWRVLFV